MKKHTIPYHILLILALWSVLPFMGDDSIMAQKSVVTRLKVVAGRWKGETNDLRKSSSDFSWFDTDMHKASGDDYVYLGYSKNAQGRNRNKSNQLDTLSLPKSMITGVIVQNTEEKKLGGVAHTIQQNGRTYDLIEYDQVDDAHKDRKGPYRGSLRGRYCSSGHKHIYISHTGSNDYHNRQVLKDLILHTSHKDGCLGNCNLNSNSACERYLEPVWHTHVPVFSVSDEREHRVTCSSCYLDQLEYHNYRKRYGVEVRTMYPRFEADGKLSKLAAEYHYKTCETCGFKLKEEHDFYNPTASESQHAEICKYCGYTKQASHRDYGKVKMPVNDSIHAMMCDECAYIGYSPHSFGAPISMQWLRCDEGVASFKCIECDHLAYRKVDGIGHDFTDRGFCRRPGCIYRYQPAERDSAGVYHIRNAGNLYWFAGAVNLDSADINAVLDCDIDCDAQSDPEWTPIGYAPSHAYSGTFDAANYCITGIATRSMTHQDRTKGIFGYVGQKGIVRNLVVSSVQIDGWADLGIIAGRNDGTITGCTVSSGRVTAGMQGAYLGGICGVNGGSITDCYVSQHVWLGTPSQVAGGICGNNSGSVSAVSAKAIYAQEDINPLPPVGNESNQ